MSLASRICHLYHLMTLQIRKKRSCSFVIQMAASLYGRIKRFPDLILQGYKYRSRGIHWQNSLGFPQYCDNYCELEFSRGILKKKERFWEKAFTMYDFTLYSFSNSRVIRSNIYRGIIFLIAFLAIYDLVSNLPFL
ncbi:Hypothetical predicted protein [Octopus vulgaris]|uniref:Uncharacterized protein n=1 Tax=Octopus vulgaris TaxID=6645 RepID=A0AA36B5I4_OCTVU|nr:Hypothetical predicted protein [Octopus vulgaris]